MAAGDWLLIEELFERADPTFVDEIRKFDDANALGAFAQRWFADTRPEARALLFDYLDRPLNAYRHEALVKRLFKLAEAAGDDALMARFLVAFDRSVRRVVVQTHHRERAERDTEAAATALAASWRNEGFLSAYVWRNQRRKYEIWGTRVEPTIRTPGGTAMPRGVLRETYDFRSWSPATRSYKTFLVPDWALRLRLDLAQYRKATRVPPERRKDLERWRLFSIATRNYLRRRAWRYFRKLGRTHPERYVAGVKSALVNYHDADVADGLALIDNWGMIHILFHFSPVLVADDRGWKLAEGRSLADLEPAPQYARLWATEPRALVELLRDARCRPVRTWAVRMIRTHAESVLTVFTLEERLALVEHEDADVVALAAELLRNDSRLRDVPVDRWLALVQTASPSALDLVSELIERFVSIDHVDLAQAVRLAMMRPLPLARLGLNWLRAKPPRDDAERGLLLDLVEAECEPLRPEIVRWAREAVSRGGPARPDWVLEWLDSRHRDVRAEGWRWLVDEPAVRDDVTTWQRLMESPYDDVRLALVGALELRGRSAPDLATGDLDAERLRLLWASVLLNVHRGNRAKPIVVRQLLRRLEARPGELAQLLPLIAVALRSARGPERRAGLVGVVQLAERNDTAVSLIRDAFPELQLQ